MGEPIIKVGIVTAQRIQFKLNVPYRCADNDMAPNGTEQVEATPTGLRWRGKVYHKLSFVPTDMSVCSFSLLDVTIGVGFHWERQELQTFRGTLCFLPTDGKVCAVNILPVEDYLCSVISSEMSPTASLEFLKAHAVISRSWLLAQIDKKEKNDRTACEIRRPGILLKWYERDDHTLFDVCADDHCQRYQGVTRVKNANAHEAISQTRGQVLTYDGDICDARFSKCCGGRLELFSSCWEDVDKPYLLSKSDIIYNDMRAREVKDAFCNTADAAILSQVLNAYDQETHDFYRWTVAYTRQELSQLVRQKSGIDFGLILDLRPVRRGPSGRIVQLEVVGTRQTLTVGKELEIRRWLSPSHLYSSAFEVEHTAEGFVLHGKGWGHGVGLCQIGAAVMGTLGYRYDEILQHYYPGATLIQRY